jgi:hypothetical protein
MIEILIKQYKLFNIDDYYLHYCINNNLMVYTKINKDNFNKIHIIHIIKINILHIYNFISSNKFLPYHQIIYGEKIQELCDVVIGSQSSLLFNPNNMYFSKELKLIDNIDINKYKTLFVFTHDLDKFYNNYDISDKILITHNSDHEINKKYNCKKHFCQNNFIKDNISIPIGIENNQWFNHNLLIEVLNMNITKNKLIYFNFNLNTHPSRINCYNILKNKLIKNNNLPKKEYFIELAKHKYCICPRGNGLDTHRLWECLYLDVIPIMIKDDNINISNLPIIFLEKWEDLDINNLPNIFKNLENSKLTLSYYKDLLEFYNNVNY